MSRNDQQQTAGRAIQSAQPSVPQELPWLQPAWAALRGRFSATGRAPHALMLTGTSGCGRQATAMHLAAWLLCQQATADAACGRCSSCRLLQAGSHPDLLQVQPEEDASSIKVEQIRDLITALNLTAGFNGWRIAIIAQAAGMTDSAANALLKTLEEPGQHTLLMLLTDTRKALPATIYSRCQQLVLPLPDNDEAMRWLQQHADADSASLRQALALAHGSALQAWSLLQDDTLSEAQTVADALHGMTSDTRQDAAAVLSQWQALPAERCWYWLQYHLHAFCRSLLAANADKTLLQAVWQSYDQASKSLALAASGLRQDLQLQAWLLQWQALCQSHAMIRFIDQRDSDRANA